MKIYDFAQRSLEWHAARAGVVTASEIDALVTPTWKVRDSAGVDTYLARKLAERWTGGAAEQFTSEAMDYGIEMEAKAVEHFGKHYGTPISSVGFITDDPGNIGCSPDGLIGEDEGLEVKCPTAAVHVRYLLDNTIPREYAAQVQFSLYVTKRKRWHFLSYRPGFPQLHLTAEPNAAAFAAFDAALEPFLEQMEQDWKFICDRNGGPPDVNYFRQQLIQAPSQLEQLNASDLDIIP